MGIRALRLALLGAIGFASAYAQGTVAISPAAASVHLGAYFIFSDKVTGIATTTVGWTVALPAGATGSPGTISTGGLYVPPATMPSSGT